MTNNPAEEVCSAAGKAVELFTERKLWGPDYHKTSHCSEVRYLDLALNVWLRC